MWTSLQCGGSAARGNSAARQSATRSSTAVGACLHGTSLTRLPTHLVMLHGHPGGVSRLAGTVAVQLTPWRGDLWYTRMRRDAGAFETNFICELVQMNEQGNVLPAHEHVPVLCLHGFQLSAAARRARIQPETEHSSSNALSIPCYRPPVKRLRDQDVKWPVFKQVRPRSTPATRADKWR